MSGWGSQGWGNTPWGGSLPPTTMEVVSALSIAENIIQLGFSVPIYYSGLLDQPDSSDPSKYTVAVVSGTTGLDGNTVRPVTVVQVVQSQPANVGGDLPVGAAAGTYLDLILDRPMTPYPSQYTVTLSAFLFSADFTMAIDPAAEVQTVYGLFKQIVQPQAELPTPTRDFSNPQSILGQSSLPQPATLGVFGTTVDGDYAIDQGLQSYKKRIYRRLVSRPNGFAHLGEAYGVGIMQQGKKLATAAVQQRIASQAEKQIAREPETDRVRVQLAPSANDGKTKITILVQPKGAPPQKWVTDVPTQT